MDGIRAALYAEMAKAAAGERPQPALERGSDVAIERAIRFVHASGLDESTRRQLLGEVSAARRAVTPKRSRDTVVELFERLAAEFRWRVRHR